jgi:hypothetical protein
MTSEDIFDDLKPILVGQGNIKEQQVGQRRFDDSQGLSR